MKAIKYNHDLYLECDISLLADIFEKFRNINLKNYGLCLSHYLSVQAVSWDAILNMIRDDLELNSDADMYLLFEKGMRGGVSYISKGYSKANNKNLKYHDLRRE